MTKTQRTLLRAIASDGAYIERADWMLSGKIRNSIRTAGDPDLGPNVSERTFQAILAQGWIERHDELSDRGPLYKAFSITAAGRAAARGEG